MNYLIGIDIGTSGTKTVLFSESGEAVASHTVDYPMYQPFNGWAEQEPEDWYNAVIKTLKAVMEKSGVSKNDVKALGLSGQMHGLVMLDKDNKVLRPSIIWCDQRTEEECIKITEKVGKEKLIEITANPAITGFTASKIMWVKDNEPEIYNKCRHILLPKDYIRFRLTGVYATEVSDASGMQILDVKNRCWSSEVLNILDIDEELLGKVFESQEITGYITKETADLTGLEEGTVVVGGAGDNAAAAVGTGVVEDGKAFTTLGTSGVVFAHTDKLSIDLKGRVHTFCCAVPNAWHVMGVTQAAGLSLKWFRDNFCSDEIEEAKLKNIDSYDIMNKMVEEVPIGSNKLIYLPYLMGERTPHLDPNCRGVFFGLSAIHKKADLIRAVMEGVSFSQRDSLEILRSMNVVTDTMYACGGGGKSAVWRQMLADIYSCPVKTINSTEGPALGVAILAGVGAGIFTSVSEGCKKVIKVKDTQNPITENSKIYEKYYKVYKNLYPALKSEFKELQAIDNI